MSGWTTLWNGQSGRLWKSGGNKSSGGHTSMQAALDEMHEMQYEYPRLTFKLVQNADTTYSVAIVADNGQDNKSFAGTSVPTLNPANAITDVGQASPRPSGEANGDQLDAQGAERPDGLGAATVGGPISSVRESWITQFMDPVAFTG